MISAASQDVSLWTDVKQLSGTFNGDEIEQTDHHFHWKTIKIHSVQKLASASRTFDCLGIQIQYQEELGTTTSNKLAKNFVPSKRKQITLLRVIWQPASAF